MVRGYTFPDTINIPPNAIWNKYKVLKKPPLPHATPEHTEGLNYCIFIKEFFFFLSRENLITFCKGAWFSFFALGPQNHKPEFASHWSAASACLENLWVLDASPVNWETGPIACTSPAGLGASAHQVAQIIQRCCPERTVWARMVVRVAAKCLCFRTLDKNSEVIGW